MLTVASPNVTGVDRTIQPVITVPRHDGRLEAPCNGITDALEAGVVSRAGYGLMLTVAELRVTRVYGAHVAIVTVLGRKRACSAYRVTRGDQTGIIGPTQ